MDYARWIQEQGVWDLMHRMEGIMGWALVGRFFVMGVCLGIGTQALGWVGFSFFLLTKESVEMIPISIFTWLCGEVWTGLDWTGWGGFGVSSSFGPVSWRMDRLSSGWGGFSFVFCFGKIPGAGTGPAWSFGWFSGFFFLVNHGSGRIEKKKFSKNSKWFLLICLFLFLFE